MNIFHPTYSRLIPARRPADFEPAAGRHSLRWRRPVPYLIADWFGIQGVEPQSRQAQEFVRRLIAAFDDEPTGPGSVEVTNCLADEAGLPAVIVVAYWTSADAHATWSLKSQWERWWKCSDRFSDSPGYWRETLICPYDRHETVYSHEHYRAGLARSPNSEMSLMTDNGYFGAARDRIPASSIDELASPLGTETSVSHADTRGRRILVLNPLNTTVIRSGQFWQDSEPDQMIDYEVDLQPKLDRAMNYLAANPASGCIYLRRLTNIDNQSQPRRETSIYAVFQDLAGLELWAADHATHQAIYEHQIAAGRRYGNRRDVKTWHEAFVLPANNRFEYVNCAPGTGMTRAARATSFVAEQQAPLGVATSTAEMNP